MLGLWVPGDSVVHRLPAGVKLSGLVAASVAVFGAGSPVWLAAGLAATLGLAVLAAVPLRTLLAHTRPALALLAVLVLAHGLTSGWAQGMVVGLRFGVLVLGATLVTLTTRVADMVAVIEGACRPLQRVGVAPGKVALVLALAVRFVPVLAATLREVREAQWARGADRPTAVLLVPFLVRTLRFADQTAEALDARGFEG